MMPIANKITEMVGIESKIPAMTGYAIVMVK
jgi:hypothetical protein